MHQAYIIVTLLRRSIYLVVYQSLPAWWCKWRPQPQNSYIALYRHSSVTQGYIIYMVTDHVSKVSKASKQISRFTKTAPTTCIAMIVGGSSSYYVAVVGGVVVVVVVVVVVTTNSSSRSIGKSSCRGYVYHLSASSRESILSGHK